MAKRMDVSAGTIKLLEGGGVKWNTRHLTSAAEVLGVSVHDLIPSDADPPTPIETACSTGDPAAILRAVADELDRTQAAQVAGGDDPLLNALAEAYLSGRKATAHRMDRAAAWDSMMGVLMQLRQDWGIDPPRKPRR